MTATLRLGPRFSLPLQAVTETLGILAVKRAGKSNTAVVMAEAMYDAGLPWVAIDPKGDWWGIRADGDGKAVGLEVIVFGGEHGDVPLEPTAGKLIADLVVDNRLTCVLDVSEMTKADMRRFLHDFADRLYRKNREPLHVFCEEADEYIPQHIPTSRGETGITPAKVVGVFETLVKRGGFRGIGITLISQRSASLNKDVLTQVGTLIAMRTPSPQDRKAIFAWIDYHDAGREIIDELPTLPNGTAFVISPEFLHEIKKVGFRKRRTFDSGATPEIGKKVRAPARLADVDLDAIKIAMADTIEKQKAGDPKELQKRVAQLERELKEVTKELNQLVDEKDVLYAAARDHVCEGEATEVPVLTNEILTRLETVANEILETMRVKKLDFGRLIEVQNQRLAKMVETEKKAGRERINSALHRVNETSPPPARPRKAVADSGEVKLGKAERAILTVLAQHPDGRRRQQLTSQTGYTYSGGFRNSLASLRTAGFIVGGNNDTMKVTDAGLGALGDYDELPTGAALLDHWMGRLSKAEGLALSVLLEHPTRLFTGPELAETCDYEYSGGFRNALSRLRTLELIRGTNTGGMTVDVDFMEAIQ